MLKKILYFILVWLWVFNFGSFGYLLYFHKYLFAVASLAGMAMAAPFIKKIVENLLA